MKKKFYDTNALLNLGEKLLENEDKFYVSQISLQELENRKNNRNKDEGVRAKARHVARVLAEHGDAYEFVPYAAVANGLLVSLGMPETPDNMICACAATVRDSLIMMDDTVVFVTADLCCRLLAKNVFELDVEEVEDTKEDNYTGYLEVSLSDEDMADLYSNLTINKFELLTNQYLIVKNSNDEIVDKLIWTGDEYQNIKLGTIKSSLFGTIKPYNGDVYQQCAINSLINNKLTMLTGKAGTGKTHLAMGVMLSMLEKHKIDKIIVFCNPVATINSARLGFYPGTKDDKLLDSQSGNILSSKLGGSVMLEQMIQQDRIVLMPMSDIRGYDTSGMNAAIYITEAENMDVTLMKLAMQRIGDDCICIIDGDYKQQVDMSQYAGDNNGMRRLSQVYRGQPFYGEVELKNIYRSKIAEIADLM